MVLLSVRCSTSPGLLRLGLPPQRLAPGYSSEVQQREHELLAECGVHRRALCTIAAPWLACRKYGTKRRWPDTGRVQKVNAGFFGTVAAQAGTEGQGDSRAREYGSSF